MTKKPKTATNPRGAGRAYIGDAVSVTLRLSPLAIEWLDRQPKKATAIAALVEAQALSVDQVC
jgi:hypothetical protein